MKDRLDKFALDLFSRGQLMGDNVIPDDVQVVIIQNKLYPELLPKYMRDRVERSEGLEVVLIKLGLITKSKSHNNNMFYSSFLKRNGRRSCSERKISLN